MFGEISNLIRRDKIQIIFIISMSKPVDNYFCWVAFEHASNNYLRLLHAETVRVR
jgi:hypothetical protein